MVENREPTGFTLVANYKSPTIVDKESQSQKIVLANKTDCS